MEPQLRICIENFRLRGRGGSGTRPCARAFVFLGGRDEPEPLTPALPPRDEEEGRESGIQLEKGNEKAS